jgi:hypothetical protein
MNSALAGAKSQPLANDLSAIMQTSAAFLAKPRTLLFDGAWVAPASGKTFEVRDPSSDRGITDCAEADSAGVDLAVAAARRAGDELELVTRPMRSLTFRGGLGLLNATISRRRGREWYDPCQRPSAAGGSAGVGDPVDRLGPIQTGRKPCDAASRQQLHIGTILRAGQRGPDRAVPYALLNARATWFGPGEKWYLALWDNNVTNHFYLTNAYDLQALGFDDLRRGLPREFGVDAGYHF